MTDNSNKKYPHGYYTIEQGAELGHDSTLYDTTLTGKTKVHRQSHLNDSNVKDSEVAGSNLYKFPTSEGSYVEDSICKNGSSRASHIIGCQWDHLAASESWLVGIKGRKVAKCHKSTVCCGAEVGDSVYIHGTVMCGTGDHDLGNTCPGGEPGGKAKQEAGFSSSVSDLGSMTLYTPGTTTAGTSTVGQNTPTGSMTPMLADLNSPPMLPHTGTISIPELSEFCASLVCGAFREYVQSLVNLSSSIVSEQMTAEMGHKIRTHLENPRQC